MSVSLSQAESVEREIRFATVMYGGVSLAIYMNGIAQELLHMVRSSASRAENDAPLEGTEMVFRKIAQHLGEHGDWDPRAIRNASEGDPLRARFVMDILSGTSAGGINAIFLAKAMARGESIASLADLWLDRGDLAQLINDGPSTRREKPKSLLDSHLMYDELLDAFNGMDGKAAGTTAPGSRRPLATDVDLFITTTDITGLPLMLRLADGVVWERRHRNVFHLRYSDGSNSAVADHFLSTYNPFLAFIARCTSSFPAAFEPMTLGDSAGPAIGGDGTPWREFFPAYTGMDDGPGGLNDPGGVGRDNRTEIGRAHV